MCKAGEVQHPLFTERLRKADRKTESSSIGFMRNGTSHVRNRRARVRESWGIL